METKLPRLSQKTLPNISPKNNNFTSTSVNFAKINRPFTQGNQSVTSLNRNTMKFISNANPIEILPSEIFFKDIEINKIYEITIFARNLTKVPRRIRVLQPQTTKFRCDYDMVGALAAGIALRLIITFETNMLGK